MVDKHVATLSQKEHLLKCNWRKTVAFVHLKIHHLQGHRDLFSHSDL